MASALPSRRARTLPRVPSLPDCLPIMPGTRGLAANAFRERIWIIGVRLAAPPKHTGAAVQGREDGQVNVKASEVCPDLLAQGGGAWHGRFTMRATPSRR